MQYATELLLFISHSHSYHLIQPNRKVPIEVGMQKVVEGCLGRWVYKAEDVVQDIPASSFALKLESLRVAHGLLLSIDLYLCEFLR